MLGLSFSLPMMNVISEEKLTLTNTTAHLLYANERRWPMYRPVSWTQINASWDWWKCKGKKQSLDMIGLLCVEEKACVLKRIAAAEKAKSAMHNVSCRMCKV